jgi:hypothetical protein
MALLSFSGVLARLQAGVAKLFVRHPTLVSAENGGTDAEHPVLPRYCYDASLLFRRLALLRIDRDELAREEPLLAFEFQGRCALCRSKKECIADLDREERTGEPQDWREYCPNAAMLNALGAVQNCPRAAQYLKVPYAWS